MKRSQSCDFNRLDLLLQDRLPVNHVQDVEAHLTVCPACRRELEKLAGEERWWEQARRNLGSDGASELLATSVFSSLGRRPTRFDLGFLQPSDSPETLGRLGNYEVLEVVGHGGMGIVLKAFDPALHRPVAIKVLAAEYAANGAARKRFAREAQAAAAVIHDHVVPVHAVDANATPPYLVMSYISGPSLQQRLDDSGALEVKEILRIGMQTALGLAAAHAQGLVHRDIKPANIMLENGIERVRITDFGLARAVDDASISHSGTLAGTPQYMAPEQARGEPVDQRADLFALGSTMYAMCTGRPPFRGDSGVAVLRQVSDASPAPIHSLNSDIPAWLVGIVAKLHSKNPADRFQTAAEVAELLERCLAHVQQPSFQPLPKQACDLAKEFSARRIRMGLQHWQMAAALMVIAASAIYAHWTLKRLPESSARAKTTVAAESAEAAYLIPPTGEEIAKATGHLRTRLHELNRSTYAFTTPTSDSVKIAKWSERAQWLWGRFREATAPDVDPLAERIADVRTRIARLMQEANGQSN